MDWVKKNPVSFNTRLQAQIIRLERIIKRIFIMENQLKNKAQKN